MQRDPIWEYWQAKRPRSIVARRGWSATCLFSFSRIQPHSSLFLTILTDAPAEACRSRRCATPRMGTAHRERCRLQAGMIKLKWGPAGHPDLSAPHKAVGAEQHILQALSHLLRVDCLLAHC